MTDRTTSVSSFKVRENGQNIKTPSASIKKMATTRSSITRLLRASVSHRPAITTLHNFHRTLHIFTATSPLSFLRSHPSNLPISNLNLFSTCRRGRPRATKSKLRGFLGWTAWVLLGGAVIICVEIFFVRGLFVIWEKFVKRLDDEMGTKFKGSLRDEFRKGHSVVFDGNLILLKKDNMTRGFKYCFSATEVLTKPDELAAAMEKIKLNVPEEKQNVVVNRCPTPSGCEVSLVLEGWVEQSVAFSLMARILILMLLSCSLDNCEGLQDGLREGHSFVVEGSLKLIENGITKEDKSGKSVAVKVWGLERHLSAEVFGKHVNYMPQDDAAAGGIEEEEN